MDAAEILKEAAAVYKDRNAAYGENWRKVGPLMAQLFGKVTLETADDYNRFHILMLAIVKLTRYTQNWAKGGHEDSAYDSAVYWAILQSIDGEIAREVNPPPWPPGSHHKPIKEFTPPFPDIPF